MTKSFCLPISLFCFLSCQGSFEFPDTELSRNRSNNLVAKTPDETDPDKIPDLPVEDYLTIEGYFEEEVWPKVAESSCISCHSSIGVAKESGLLLEDEDTANVLSINREIFRKYATQIDPNFPNESYLSLKATNQVEQEGGEVLKVGGKGHEIINSFTKRLAGLQG